MGSGINWQDVATLAIITLACAFLIRRAVTVFRRPASHCSRGCSGCQAHADSPGRPNGPVPTPRIVSLGPVIRRDAEQAHTH